MQSIFYMEIYKIMIVKIISPEDEQAYMLDNDIDIRHMLIAMTEKKICRNT